MNALGTIERSRLWRDPNPPHRERKRLARFLPEDVTLIKKDQILVHIRFPGGALKTLELPIPVRPKLTRPVVVAEVDWRLGEKLHLGRSQTFTSFSYGVHLKRP